MSRPALLLAAALVGVAVLLTVIAEHIEQSARTHTHQQQMQP